MYMGHMKVAFALQVLDVASHAWPLGHVQLLSATDDADDELEETEPLIKRNGATLLNPFRVVTRTRYMPGFSMNVAILQYGGFWRQGMVNVDGTVKVICVPSLEDAMILLEPKYTVLPLEDRNPVPVIVTIVPAWPDLGLREEICGRCLV